MSTKYIMRNRLIDEIDDPRILYDAKRKNEAAFKRLEDLRKERVKLDYDMEKLRIEMKEFEKYEHDELIKMEEDKKVITEFENIIKEQKIKQEICREKIKLITSDTEQANEVIRLAKIRTENYRPYEEFISKVIEKNPQYKNVFDLIEHIQEIALITKLGPTVIIPEYEDDKNKQNPDEIQSDLTECYYSTDYNDARTYLKELKDADLEYIKQKSNVKSKCGRINFQRVDPYYLKNDLENMKDKLNDLELEIPRQKLKATQRDHRLVISLISRQYRELYFQNYGKLLTDKIPSSDDQLKYIFEFYKKTLKRLDIYKTMKK